MVKKILALWALYARMDLLWLLKDCKNFTLCTVTDVIINMASITGIWLIAGRFNGIGGMGMYQILFMLGYSLAVRGIINTFFNFNVFHISRRIGRGQMDHILIMPQPVWITLLTEGFVPVSGSGVLISGFGLIAYAVTKMEYRMHALFIAALAVCILLSAGISITYSFVWGSLAFYSPVAAEEVCSSVDNLFASLKNFPLNGIGTAGQFVMLTVLPVGLYAWFPAMALIGASGYLHIVVLAAIAAVYAGLVVLLFRKGLLYYVRNGSYRYHSRGHRR